MSKIYKVNSRFAREKNIPVYFVANQLTETPRAMYLYGRGTTETRRMGICCSCGRELTHPVSLELGIGPECGQHFHDWNLIGGYNIENIERLKGAMQSIKIDTWVPKSCIKEVLPTVDVVETPENHPILIRNEEAIKPSSAINSTIHTKSNREASKTYYAKTGEAAIKITFPFNVNDLEKVKTLSGRRFHNEGLNKYWTCPLTKESVFNLKEWGFILDNELSNILNRALVKPENITTIKEIDIPGLRKSLFPFQKKGVSFIELKEGRALIADEMGLGKTVQALAWLQLHPEHRPVIIVVPASLKYNWMNEASAWMQHPKVQVISGTNTGVPIIGEIIIINYDILHAWVDELLKIKPSVLITDECHYFKNKQAQRSKAVLKLGKNIPHIICLSGTPIVNRPVEFYNAIKLIDPALFPNFFYYAKNYCGAKHNGFGWDFNGSSNTEELHKKLIDSIMIRRKKAEVLTDLPDKLYSFLPMELSNAKEYKKAENDFIAWVKENKGAAAAERASSAAVLAEIEGLKQLAVLGKLPQAFEWIENFLEVDGKLVVFANHKFVIDALMNKFGNIAVKIDGSVENSARQKAVEEFQTNDNIRLFVGNIKAAGVGITLTAASNVAFLELPWTPGDLSQAEDRCHRIGQKDTVNIHYLLASETIEEKLANIIDAKRAVLDSILDGELTQQDSLLSELMKTFN